MLILRNRSWGFSQLGLDVHLSIGFSKRYLFRRAIACETHVLTTETSVDSSGTAFDFCSI